MKAGYDIELTRRVSKMGNTSRAVGRCRQDGTFSLDAFTEGKADAVLWRVCSISEKLKLTI